MAYPVKMVPFKAEQIGYEAEGHSFKCEMAAQCMQEYKETHQYIGCVRKLKIFVSCCQEYNYHYDRQVFGEPCEPDSPVFYSTHTKGHISVRGLQVRCKKIMALSGLEGHSLRHLRHTHATFLLSASKNLRLVQKQLGHSKITTTQVYADVLGIEYGRALERLYQ